jgi:hypothetical protein
MGLGESAGGHRPHGKPGGKGILLLLDEAENLELQRFELAKSGMVCVQKPSELVLRIPPKQANQGLLRTQQDLGSAPQGTLQKGFPVGDIRSLKVEKSWMVTCPA